MGFWKQFVDACVKEYSLTQSVDRFEREAENRKERERERRKEERERKRELAYQRKYMLMCLPTRLEKYEHNREKLKAAAFKLTGESIDDYADVLFDDDYFESVNQPPVEGSYRRHSSSGYSGCGYTPSSQRNYELEEAEAEEARLQTVCNALLVGIALRKL